MTISEACAGSVTRTEAAISAAKARTRVFMAAASRGGPKIRRRALDQDPIARAHIRPVIPDGEMLGAAVVPERDGVLCPAEAQVPMRPRAMVEEKFEDGRTLVAGQLVDLHGHAAIDIDELAPGLGVPRDHRMRGGGIDRLSALVVGERAVMQRGQAFEE